MQILLQGVCADKSKVTGDLAYDIASFKVDTCRELDTCLKKIHSQIQEDLTLYSYEARLSRFIHALIINTEMNLVHSYIPSTSDTRVY